MNKNPSKNETFEPAEKYRKILKRRKNSENLKIIPGNCYQGHIFVQLTIKNTSRSIDRKVLEYFNEYVQSS